MLTSVSGYCSLMTLASFNACIQQNLEQYTSPLIVSLDPMHCKKAIFSGLFPSDGRANIFLNEGWSIFSSSILVITSGNRLYPYSLYFSASNKSAPTQYNMVCVFLSRISSFSSRLIAPSGQISSQSLQSPHCCLSMYTVWGTA